MTLRRRLVLVLLGLVALGLLVAGAVTYASLRSFLLDRIDDQLTEARMPLMIAVAADNLPVQLPVAPDQPRPRPQLPPGTWGQVRDHQGNVVGEPVTFAYGESAPPAPSLPSPLPSPGTENEPTVFSTGAVGDSGLHYRVLVSSVAQSDYTLVVAIPLTDMQQTLSRLLLVEALVTVVVLALLAVAARFIVGRGLRPLADMGITAGAIAAGDLGRRVEPIDERTEVGRLGVALNAMLTQIEAAFAERTASEERLRRFLADASHELRTPLTSIRGYAELFDRGAGERPEDLAIAMRRVEEEAARMGLLVDDLLLLARLGQTRPPRVEPVDLAAVAADAVHDARAVDPEREITIETEGATQVGGDLAQLRQVAANLLTNALRHTPPGTPVRIAVKGGEDAVELAVHDDGPGLTPEQAERAFDPFYRADPSRSRSSGGSGLGLAIAAAIVTAHGGALTLDTTPGEGATFIVRLPRDATPISHLQTSEDEPGDDQMDRVEPATDPGAS